VLNKLAEMGDELDRRAMLERLFVFMEHNGTPIVAVPTISKLTVDLYKLYHIVRQLGGMVEVTSISIRSTCFAFVLVHGQVTIIFVVSVGSFVCLCRVFLSRL